MQMIKKVTEYVKRHQMLSDGDIIIAGISGGADSVCLFWVLLELCKQIKLSIQVVHVNHQIREEAALDERFVQELCSAHQIPFHAEHVDVEALAKKEHITTEEAGRKVRYEIFYKYLAKYAPNGNGKIAVAHNKNDSAETVLFHLFRGSGIQGLTGIAPVRDNIIRPLLCVERSEIEDYLREISQQYCTDKTNLTDLYARNRVRHHILDYAQKEICQGAVGHTQEAAQKLSDICGLLDRLSRRGCQECVCMQDEKAIIDKRKLSQLDKVLHSYIVLYTLQQLTGTGKDISSVHIEAVLQLFEKQTGKKVSLPYGYCATREYEGIVIQKERTSGDGLLGEQIPPIPLEPEMNTWKEAVLDDGNILEYGIFPRTPEEIIPQKTYTKWFDYDKIKGSLFIRKRAASDFIVVNDKGQKQTLKAYFVNEKIPRQRRDGINLLACEHHVLWILGSRISSYYKISKHTQLILKVNVRGGAQDG